MNVQQSARNCAVALGAAVLIGTGVSSAAVAAPAAPYTCQIQVSLEFGQGIRKISVVVNCAQPGELVRIDIIVNVDSQSTVGAASARQLAMLRADSEGVARGTVSLPENAACDATIKATGLQSKRTAYSDIYIEPCNSQAGAAAVPNRTAPSSSERTVVVNPGAAVNRAEQAAAKAPAARKSTENVEAVDEIKSATKARAVHEASAPRTITLAGADRDLIDEATRIEPELLAMSSDTGGPLNPATAATGLGLLLVGLGAGTLLARRREDGNHY